MLLLSSFTFLHRLHTDLTNTNTINERHVHTCTYRRYDCTYTTTKQFTLFFFERQQYPAQAQTTSNPFSQTLLYSLKSCSFVSLNLIQNFETINFLLAFFPTLKIALRELPKIIKFFQKHPNIGKLRIFFSLCRTVVKEEISVTKKKKQTTKRTNERISAPRALILDVKR